MARMQKDTGRPRVPMMMLPLLLPQPHSLSLQCTFIPVASPPRLEAPLQPVGQPCPTLSPGPLPSPCSLPTLRPLWKMPRPRSSQARPSGPSHPSFGVPWASSLLSPRGGRGGRTGPSLGLYLLGLLGLVGTPVQGHRPCTVQVQASCLPKSWLAGCLGSVLCVGRL